MLKLCSEVKIPTLFFIRCASLDRYISSWSLGFLIKWAQQ